MISEVLGTVMVFALLGIGLNIVVGYAGLLDLGYVFFFALGAYSLALLTGATLNALRDPARARDLGRPELLRRDPDRDADRGGGGAARSAPPSSGCAATTSPS